MDPAGRVGMVLVTGNDGAMREQLARDAGCSVPLPGVAVETLISCPARLKAPSHGRTGGGRSCEQARQEYVRGVGGEKAAGAPPDPTKGVYGPILKQGRYLVTCNVNETWAVSVSAAVQNGVAVGVSVFTVPSSIDTADCIAAEIRKLSFPVNPTMDIADAIFEASR